MVDQPLDTIASFRGLEGNQARAQFLHHLVVELSPYERRALRDVLNLETHQKDFISSLPLELVHIVLQYLDVSELFSLRRVSRCWLHRLASTDLCRVILRRSFSEKAVVVDSNDLDLTTRLFSKAQQRHAFRTGRPYSKASFPIKLTSQRIAPEARNPALLLDYHDGKLAWVDHSSRADIVRTLNLTNGRVFAFVPQNRESVNQIKISDTLFAIITSLGVCHAYDLITEEDQSFHIRSLSPIRISVAARHIAVVGSAGEAGFASVLLRAFDTRKSSVLNVFLGSDSWAQGVVLHPGGDAFYLITTVRPHHPYDEPARSSGAKMEFLKFNFKGEMTFKRECWAKSEWIFNHWNWGFGLMASGSHYSIALGTRYIGLDRKIKNTPVYEDHYIHYDMESEKVVYEKSTRRVSEAEYGSSQPERSGPLRQNIRCNDMAYFIWYKARRLDSILAQKVNESSSAWKTEILNIDSAVNSERQSAKIMLYSDDAEDYWLAVDERFLVLIEYEEIQVWCFDPHLVMPNDEPQYRAERTRRADARAAERKLHAMKT